MSDYFLDTQAYLNPFKAPPMEHIILSLQNKIPNSESMIVQPLRGNLQGVYKITIQNADLHGVTIPIDFPDKSTVELPLEGDQTPPPDITTSSYSRQQPPKHSFFANKFQHGEQKRNGTLLTFARCTSGPIGKIPNATFDTAVQAFGELIKMTEYQRIQGTTCLNGNRYCVIEPKEGKIPPTIQIPDENGQFVSIPIRYRGQSYFCGVCNASHVGACPAKTAFYAQKDLRAKLTITMQIISDSTLRQADQLGLMADLTCMSGGRVGNVANILHDDPAIHEKTDVVVVAGFNDINNDKEDLATFNLKADCAISKLVHTAFEKQPKIRLVTPILAPNFTTALQELKLAAYKDLIQTTSEQRENVFVITPDPATIEFHGIHPTPKGTANLLQQINEDMDQALIHNTNFIVAKSIYQGCTSILNYGCVMCSETFDIRGGLCPKCLIAHAKPIEDIIADVPNDVKKLLSNAVNEHQDSSGVSTSSDSEMEADKKLPPSDPPQQQQPPQHPQQQQQQKQPDSEQKQTQQQRNSQIPKYTRERSDLRTAPPQPNKKIKSKPNVPPRKK